MAIDQAFVAVGLAVDVFGFLAIALAKHSTVTVSNHPPPPDQWKDGDLWFTRENGDAENKVQYRLLRLGRQVWVGACLVVLGFVLQFIGVIL